MARYDGPGHADDTAEALAVSADGSLVFVTGALTVPPGLSDFGTLAYASGTG